MYDVKTYYSFISFGNITQNKAWPAQIKQHWSSSALREQTNDPKVCEGLNYRSQNQKQTEKVHLIMCISSRVRNKQGVEEQIQRLEVVTRERDVRSFHLDLLPWRPLTDRCIDCLSTAFHWTSFYTAAVL